jgi:hypothetical protein
MLVLDLTHQVSALGKYIGEAFIAVKPLISLLISRVASILSVLTLNR